MSKEKNIAVEADSEPPSVKHKRAKFQEDQKAFESCIYSEIEKFDSFDIPFIGMKGIFLRDIYYGKIDRFFDDIDIVIQSKNASVFYEKLKSIGYEIEPRTFYDMPAFKMKIHPEQYLQNTQTLMMRNPRHKVSLDLHSNLNITNVHFTDSVTRFDTDEFLFNSKPFGNYKNVRIFECHDNLCILMRHLMKHHVFYGKTQTGLNTALQHLLDLAVIINSDEFDDLVLYSKVEKYNIPSEAIFCLTLYNKLFTSCIPVDITPYKKLLKKSNYRPTWFPILKAELNMKIEDIMLGNYSEYFPKLQKAVNRCESLKSKNLNWALQALVLSLNINKLL